MKFHRYTNFGFYSKRKILLESDEKVLSLIDDFYTENFWDKDVKGGLHFWRGNLFKTMWIIFRELFLAVYDNQNKLHVKIFFPFLIIPFMLGTTIWIGHCNFILSFIKDKEYSEHYI